MVNWNNQNDNRGYSGANFSFLWSFIRALFIHKDSQPSSNSGEEDSGGGEIYGENIRNIWFANDPVIEERNYLAVQSGMRYAIYMC